MTDPQFNPQAPLTLHHETVRADWIDYNGHMNVAYYVLVFDHATDAVMNSLGIGPAYVAAGQGAMFVVECHVTYDRELTEGDPVVVESQLLDCDAKRVQLFHRMRHADEGFQAATTEIMLVHVDQETRRSAPMPDAARERLDILLRRHATLGRPKEAGRVLALPRR
jgi:acyl-CoA thioester hydrolase